MKLAIVSFGHADSALHFVKTMSKKFETELIFVFALNKRFESILNFEKEELHTGFLDNEQVKRILGKPVRDFIDEKFKVKFFINYNLKLRSLKNIFLSRRLANYLNNFDIIHFNGIGATIILLNYFLKNKSRVYTVHDVNLHSGEKSNKMINTAGAICNWILKSKYQVILQNSTDYKEVLDKYRNNQHKINFIPFKCLSIFKYFINNNIVPEKSDVLFFGRISPYKGLKYLAEAIEIVKQKIPDVRVMIAGDGNLDVNIMGNENYIIHNRYIANEEMANYISNTKIVVCPYTDATQSGVVMTSFAFGKPVIASSVGGFKDVVEESTTGLLVPPGDVNALADAILKLLSDGRKVNEMSKNITDRCENGDLSWSNIENNVENVYKNVINK